MKKYIVFALSGNKKTAKNVAEILNCELGKSSITKFKDGEILAKTLSDVRNKDVILIQSTSKPSNDKLFEILLFVDSVRRMNPKSITLVIPYLGYARQERVSWINEPVSCEVVANIIDTTKADRLLTFDLHHNDIENFFRMPLINLSAVTLFAMSAKKYYESKHIDLSNVTIVSPDHGSNKRVDNLTKLLPHTSKVILNKHRPAPNKAEHFSIDEALVKGKHCLILDDMIDTGGTLISAANLLQKCGSKSIIVMATHSVFSQNCTKKLIAANIKKIIVTNSIEKRLSKDVEQLDISPIIASYFK
ncbi:MAG: ribose-phosphate diphosphokinase [Bacilli bacterium]|nr:ribose-phosphate diphosphokinase [Bacilli bacterium]